MHAELIRSLSTVCWPDSAEVSRVFWNRNQIIRRIDSIGRIDLFPSLAYRPMIYIFSTRRDAADSFFLPDSETLLTRLRCFNDIEPSALARWMRNMRSEEKKKLRNIYIETCAMRME